jgi:hypothetical protein
VPVKVTCSHAFHSECLARWIHDQKVQRLEKAHETGEAEKEEDAVARCAVCRGEVGEDRVAALGAWLCPLWEEYERESSDRRRREAREKEEAEAEDRGRREREAKERERIEMSEWRPKPLVVISNYETNNLKLLRHAVSHKIALFSDASLWLLRV